MFLNRIKTRSKSTNELDSAMSNLFENFESQHLDRLKSFSLNWIQVGNKTLPEIKVEFFDPAKGVFDSF